MKLILGTLLFAFSLISNANTLTCQISLNNEQVFKTKVQTQLNQKTLIGSSQGITAYVSEKPGSVYLVEAFLQNQEVRIYAQGNLNNSGENVVASLWSRDSLVDVSCEKMLTK